MDKFGIFKLLNSFLDFYKQNSNGDKTFSFFPKSEKPTSLEQASTEKPVSSFSKNQQPLQEQMLSTIRSHDAFVKRVNSKSQK